MLKIRDVIAYNLPAPGAMPAPGSALASLGRVRDQAAHIIRSLEEAGYVIVPKEPTDKMLQAMTMEAPTWDDHASRRKWTAALSAIDSF